VQQNHDAKGLTKQQAASGNPESATNNLSDAVKHLQAAL